MTNRFAVVLLQRCAQAIGVALAVSVLCFVAVRQLPGDAAYRIAAGRYGYDLVDAAAADGVRAELGLDRPAWQQLLDWLAALPRLDLGASMVTARPVAAELAHHLAGTLQLAAAGLLAAVLIGTPLGFAAARRPGGVIDRATLAWVGAVRALPPFLLGLVLVVVFSVQLGLLPTVGSGSLPTLVLPAMTLGLSISGLVARMTRDAVVEVRGAGHVGFARTKGLPESSVTRRHVVRNTLALVVPYLGAQAVLLVEGVVVVESLFAWDGLGHALVHAVFWRDIPMLQGAALVLGLLVVALNTAVDVAGLCLDPRPRSRGVSA
ncbi:ABC transporter permease [Nocardioides sp.]|uniref:ABC transporter permease n=1 Tax=Nocardioides sp. TaxID=35761 RepID=UPI002C3CA584|nr:ABC transporter permease [Nocardioides sp.]HSX69222.1 ABC transporter permease [Nocardioides sp.]